MAEQWTSVFKFYGPNTETHSFELQRTLLFKEYFLTFNYGCLTLTLPRISEKNIESKFNVLYYI